MKKKNYTLLIMIVVWTIVIVANYIIYKMVPDDSKWLFWLMLGK